MLWNIDVLLVGIVPNEFPFSRFVSLFKGTSSDRFVVGLVSDGGSIFRRWMGVCDFGLILVLTHVLDFGLSRLAGLFYSNFVTECFLKKSFIFTKLKN